MIEVRRYTPQLENEWNAFVSRAKNATFLFDRRYMDYHADRFVDYSLMVYRKGKLLALLPANIVDTTLYSHQGLTYGGLLTDQKITVQHTLEVFQALNDYLSKEGIHHVVYKAIPWIYHRYPAQEDLYALTEVCHAQLTIREISSSILLGHKLKLTESRRSGIRKALANNIRCRQTDDFATFWSILDSNLCSRYHTHPVHTLAEMTLLHDRFPSQIKLYMAYQGETPLGGTLIYETPQVVHTQYISASPQGKVLGALDALLDWLINEVYSEKQWTTFDFGKSTENHGHYLNQSLIFQKEGFGGRGVCYDTYEWKIE